MSWCDRSALGLETMASSMSWTLERELCNLTGADSAEGALHVAGVLADNDRLLDLRLPKNWVRGGAETYIYIFDVVSANKTQHLILKAYVAPPGTGSLAEGVQTLMYRRKMLAEHGIAVPRIFVAGAVEWLEEFVTEELTSALRDEKRQLALASDIFLIAVALDRLGFAPIAPFADLRAEGTRAVMIDFGQDLGPPGVSFEAMACQDEALRFLQTNLAKIPKSELVECRERAVVRFLRTLLC